MRLAILDPELFEIDLEALHQRSRWMVDELITRTLGRHSLFASLYLCAFLILSLSIVR